ncbi:hypothetical protein EB001_01180 [bacterium]|nr:hypothetical protein [bacterium]
MHLPIINIQKNGESKYIDIIQNAFEKAKKYESKLSDWIITMEGMSGVQYRHFVNNLFENIENSNYLEIGCWKGSTTCSAAYKNLIKTYCIDNWKEFGGPKDQFSNNISRCMTESDDKCDIELVENDFRKLQYDNIGKYNVYMFDGPHSQDDQRDALIVVKDALEDEFIFICDDWNWGEVREGTRQGLEQSNMKVIYSIDLRTTPDNTTCSFENGYERSDWHNGYYISVIKKLNK